jgi:hypothetical protein
MMRSNALSKGKNVVFTKVSSLIKEGNYPVSIPLAKDINKIWIFSNTVSYPIVFLEDPT